MSSKKKKRIVSRFFVKSQSNDSAFTNPKEYIVGPVVEAAFSQRDSSPPPRKFVFLVTYQTTIVQENLYLILSLNTLFA